jgi:hypothetical protein
MMTNPGSLLYSVMHPGSLLYLLVCFWMIVAVAWLLRRRWPDTPIFDLSKAPIQFAKIIKEQQWSGDSQGVMFAVFMLIISNFISGFYVFYYAFIAEIVLQEIAALLCMIGGSAFWGIFILVGTINRQRTYIVCSDIAVNDIALSIEKNIARLEKLREQASSISAVADAINSGQVGAEDPRQA